MENILVDTDVDHYTLKFTNSPPPRQTTVVGTDKRTFVNIFSSPIHLQMDLIDPMKPVMRIKNEENQYCLEIESVAKERKAWLERTTNTVTDVANNLRSTPRQAAEDVFSFRDIVAEAMHKIEKHRCLSHNSEMSHSPRTAVAESAAKHFGHFSHSRSLNTMTTESSIPRQNNGLNDAAANTPTATTQSGTSSSLQLLVVPPSVSQSDVNLCPAKQQQQQQQAQHLSSRLGKALEFARENPPAAAKTMAKTLSVEI
jgi:hypothetical protein